jgi:hypothetical protein
MQKNVVWAGNPYFASHMRSAGWHVVVLPRNFTSVSWTDIVAFSGFAPDVFIYGDCSVQPFLRDVEAFPCPTVFYAIDTHIHSWYPRYAQCFDLCCVAMRDHMSGFRGHRLGNEQLLWLPLFAKDHDRRLNLRDGSRYDIVFVGKNDPVLTPGRYALLRELRGKVPLTVLQGPYAELYARAKLVLNVSEHGDLNFRVFEALGCGACLITPRVGHGLLDLFSDGRNLFTYDPEDVPGLAALITELLPDGPRREAVADAGLAAVDGKHRAAIRARELMEWIFGQDLDRLVRDRLGAQDQIRQRYLRLLYLHLAESQSNPARARTFMDFAGPGPAK